MDMNREVKSAAHDASGNWWYNYWYARVVVKEVKKEECDLNEPCEGVGVTSC